MWDAVKGSHLLPSGSVFRLPRWLRVTPRREAELLGMASLRYWATGKGRTFAAMGQYHVIPHEGRGYAPLSDGVRPEPGAESAARGSSKSTNRLRGVRISGSAPIDTANAIMAKLAMRNASQP